MGVGIERELHFSAMGPPGGPAPQPFGGPWGSTGSPPPKKSNPIIWILLGVGCLATLPIVILLMAGMITGAALFAAPAITQAMGPGEEVASAYVSPGAPFAVVFTPEPGVDYEVWLEVDLSHSGALSLQGPLNVSFGVPSASMHEIVGAAE
jgi:hypothetical protein